MCGFNTDDSALGTFLPRPCIIGQTRPRLVCVVLLIAMAMGPVTTVRLVPGGAECLAQMEKAASATLVT